MLEKFKNYLLDDDRWLVGLHAIGMGMALGTGAILGYLFGKYDC